MASDFYKKTKDLYEEFQKRELRYLNSERATSSYFHFNNEPSVQVAEYLQRLNKREKEADETFFGVMRHFETLDGYSESITKKLHKLESLKISMSNKHPEWPPTNNIYERTLVEYPYSSLQSATSFSHTNQRTLQQPKSVEFASTQTDLMFCVNCHFPIAVATEKHVQPSSLNLSLEKITLPFQNKSSNSEFLKNQTINSAIAQHRAILKEEENIMINTERDFVKIPLKENISKISEESFFQVSDSVTEHQTVRSDSLKFNPSDTTSISENNAIQKNTISSETNLKQFVSDLPAKIDNEVKAVKEDKSIQDDISEPVTSVKISTDELSKIPEQFEPTESDLNVATKIIIDDLSTVPVNHSMPDSINTAAPKQTVTNIEKSDLQKDDKTDKKSESPISFTGVPSPSVLSDNISAVSDSDSYGEKEHLKESVAYQALLGNVSAAKKIQKASVYSESESEDEVERALANAARKSSTIPTSLALQEEKSDGTQKNSVDAKPKTEPRKSISLGKSQQLSKNTRKVLGLDTSSGSEGEIRIPTKLSQKIDEDSDEFDFYD